MQQFCPPQGTKVCYNALVPRKRDATILDMGLETRVSAGLEISFPGHRPEVAAGARVTRDHARGKGQAQQRIGVSGETTTFTDEAKIRCCAVWQSRGATSFFCFIQARSGASRKQDFEGAPLSFCAEVALFGRAGTKGS